MSNPKVRFLFPRKVPYTQIYGMEIELYEPDLHPTQPGRWTEPFIDITELKKGGAPAYRTMHRLPVNAIPAFIGALQKIQAGPLGRMALEAGVYKGPALPDVPHPGDLC